jgi:hypothetical protein
VAAGGVVLVNIASRSNVLGISFCCVTCGGVTASGDNHPALQCHSNSSIIFISFWRSASGFCQIFSVSIVLAVSVGSFGISIASVDFQNISVDCIS